MFFLSGVERFLSVHCYDWYYIKWSNKIAWVLTACVYFYCAISLSVAFIINLSYDASYRIAILCNIPAALNSTYTAYNYCISIVGGTAAIAGSIIAMVLFTRRRKRVHSAATISNTVKSHVKSQWNLTRLTLCLAIVDLALVVLPTLVALITSNIVANNVRAWSLQLLCLRSFLNLIIYLVFNADFRLATQKAVGLKKNTQLQLSGPTRLTAPT